MLQYCEGTTGYAPVNLQMTHVNPLGLDALLPERALHFVQGRRCITIGFRAAIED